MSRDVPLVIVHDDLHWADISTLLLLRHLVRSLTDDRLLLIANTRPRGRITASCWANGARPFTTVLDLGGLAQGAVRQQLAGLLGDDVDDATAEHVRSLTGGNPFFVGEVGRAMDDARAGRRFSLVTPTARDAIAERLGHLSMAIAVRGGDHRAGAQPGRGYMSPVCLQLARSLPSLV